MSTTTEATPILERTLFTGTLHRDENPDTYGLDAGSWNAIRAGLFGVLVELAQPVVEHYQSDLWHDATFIREIPMAQLVGHVELWFHARASGTCLSWNSHDYEHAINEHSWRVQLDLMFGPYTYHAKVRAYEVRK